jgi:hypothetical protein
MENFEIEMELNNENNKSYSLLNDENIQIDISSIDFISSEGNQENINLFVFVLSPDKKSELILKLKANEKSKQFILNKKILAIRDSLIYIYTYEKEISAKFKIIGYFEEIKSEFVEENISVYEKDFKKIDKKESYNKLSGKIFITIYYLTFNDFCNIF